MPFLIHVAVAHHAGNISIVSAKRVWRRGKTLYQGHGLDMAEVQCVCYVVRHMASAKADTVMLLHLSAEE